jgi:hypothetical protein
VGFSIAEIKHMDIVGIVYKKLSLYALIKFPMYWVKEGRKPVLSPSNTNMLHIIQNI